MTSSKPDVRPDGRYSVKETTEILGISRRILYRYTENGMIKCGRWRANKRPFYTGKEITRVWLSII